jgi:uncharacterized protein (UPF0333 family)
MKFNKKGQGALEYLLLIGGAVLIAVIVIALLVGMGSQNATTAKERNEEAMEATDTPIRSIITEVSCPTEKTIIVNWQPIHKDTYTYTLTVVDPEDAKTDIFSAKSEPAFDSVHNPAVYTLSNSRCIVGTSIIITTLDGTKTTSSNTYVVS